MTPEIYKQVLTGGETVRDINTRIASSKHRLMTVMCNKKSHSGYDDKQYILNDKITTLPFCHHALREKMFMRNVVQDPDWGSRDEEDTVVHVVESLTPESHSPTQYTGPTMSAEGWSPPDPGLNQRVYSDNELEADIADFANLTQPVIEDEIEKCSFIDDQAAESGLSPSLLNPEPVFPIRVSTNSSTQEQPINHPEPSKIMKKCAKRTLKLISDEESINVDRIKIWKVLQIDSDSDDN